MPYMAGLKIKGTTNRTLCGGTLVSQNYILTAANCAIQWVWNCEYTISCKFENTWQILLT